MSEYKVLIPLDGSRLAEHSLAFLPALSYLGKLDVTLISVTDIPEDILEIVQSEEELREHNLLATYLREIAADLERHLGASVKAETLRGPAATRILEAAERVTPDLLVISTHGRSGLARWQRGAVADKVIRNATSPVMIVGPKAMERGQWLDQAMPPFKRILVPLDGSETAEPALTMAMQFAELYDASLHLFHVMPYIPLATGFWNTPATLREDVIAAGTTYLDRVVTSHDLGEKALTSVAIGAPANEIDAYIQANEIDLVIMTSHGRGGIARAALGSVTDRVIGSGPPVLVVRST